MFHNTKFASFLILPVCIIKKIGVFQERNCTLPFFSETTSVYTFVNIKHMCISILPLELLINCICQCFYMVSLEHFVVHQANLNIMSCVKCAKTKTIHECVLNLHKLKVRSHLVLTESCIGGHISQTKETFPTHETVYVYWRPDI